MNAKRVIGIILVGAALALLAAGVRMAQPRGVSVAEAPRVPLAQPAAQPQSALPARPSSLPAQDPPAETIDGAVVTQVFTLNEGWNAIYLGVEPVNESPKGADGVATLSIMEWVFKDLAASGALESVWTYNQPVSSRDYLIDPADGLWDEPGWLRYMPNQNMGADGVSREFLTNLHTLHANTGYLIKLKEGTSDTVTVKGKPIPGHHRWTPGAYNLAGFPIDPGQAPAVATFAPAGSPIMEIRALNSDGTWTADLVQSGGALAAGAAYFVRYVDEPLDPDYTAPLDVGTSAESMILPTEGLKFQAGLYGDRVKLRLRNLAATPVEVALALPADATVMLQLVSDVEPPTPPVDLTQGVVIPLNGNASDWVTLAVPVTQHVAGETLLEISCDSLGTRWLIPVSVESRSHSGLWLGNVVVNDVSEARLGTTDANYDLTIALASMNDSGVRGAAEMHEEIASGVSTLHVTVTLALPPQMADAGDQAAPPGGALYRPDQIAAAPLRVHGYVFVDANQNGQRDATEVGLVGVPVTLTPGGTQTTAADGSYLFDALAAGTYAVAVAAPAGYTSAFGVTVPAEVLAEEPVLAPNEIPATVMLVDGKGATAVTPEEYLAQILPEPPGYPTTQYLPYTDAYDNRLEPPLNFGFVRADTAVLRGGTCENPGSDLAQLGTVKNGQLITSYAGTLASLVDEANIFIERDGSQVVCGNIVIGAPTSFKDGRGSEARFRILLRVRGTEKGQTELVPYYAMSENERVSAVNFLSLQAPKVNISDAGFGTIGGALEFDLALPPGDPLNPFKHKYNPDHDNLDRKFQEYGETVPLYQYESYAVNRRVTLVLTDLPPGGDETSAAGLDWGGATWGGEYREVIEGLHQNTITAHGYFVIRRVLTAEQLTPQTYDK
jgi:hypothetical protein